MDYEEIYRKQGFANNPINRVVKHLTQHLKPTKRRGSVHILDLGAGDGRHTAYLARKGYQVTAIDNSSRAIRMLEVLAKKPELHITPRQVDVTLTDLLPKEIFDAIVCTYLLQDIEAQQAEQLASYVKKHVRPGGYLALAAFLGKYQSMLETLRPQFTEWPLIEEQRRKTSTLFVGHDAIEMLFKKRD